MLRVVVKLLIDIPDRWGILTAHRRRFGMKNPVYEQIRARKVKARLRMLQHAQRVSGNVSQTCRFFGVSRALFYIWKKRYKKRGRHFRHKKDLARKLNRWEAEYNEDRPHLALKGKTPVERVRELVQPSKPAKDLP